MVDWERLERIYVRVPNWVGDVVLSTPFLQALRRAAPQARILLHGKGFQLKLLEGTRHYDDTLTFKSRTSNPLWPFQEGQRVATEWGVPDLALVLPNSISSAIVARSTGAPVRCGYALGGRGLLLTHGIPVEKRGLLRPIPMVDYYLYMLRHLGADTTGIARRPELHVSDEAIDWAEQFLTRLGLNARGHRVWAINLGGSWETKRWIPAHAGKLVRLLQREGIAPLLLRGPDEGPLAEAVCAAAGSRVAGADEVVKLAELTAVLRRCEMLITTDSGPRHFGVAAGIPVLVVTGPTHPGYTAVDYPQLEVICERVDCWPCHLKRCPVDFRCMRALTAERVLAQAKGMLQEKVRTRIRVAST